MAKKRTAVDNNTIVEGKNLKFYWSLVKSKVILGLLLMVVVKLVIIIRFGWMVALDRSGGYDWLIAVFIFILLGCKLSKQKSFKNWQVSLTGAVAGISLGLLIALVDLALFRNMFALKNIILKPLIFMVIGMAIVVITFLFKYKEDKINYDIPGDGEETYKEIADRMFLVNDKKELELLLKEFELRTDELDNMDI